MTDIPNELIDALAADGPAADLFAALHRHERAAKCRWVSSSSRADERRERASQVLRDLRAHEASRRADRDRRGAALFTPPAPPKES